MCVFSDWILCTLIIPSRNLFQKFLPALDYGIFPWNSLTFQSNLDVLLIFIYSISSVYTK